MNQQEAIEKIKYALNLASELPDLEFKTAKNNIPKDIWRSISAFANRRGGGLIVFGVESNNKDVIGCYQIESMQRKLGEIFNDKMSFTLRPSYYLISWEHNKTVLAVYVPECPKDCMPCYFRPVGLPNGAYIRDGNSSRRLTDNEFRTYVASSKEFQFDLSQAVDTKLEDLSKDKIIFLLEKREESVKRGAKPELNSELLKNLGIVSKFDGEYVPTVGGYLIFSKNNPQIGYPFERYVIRCVRYAGNDVSSTIIDKSDIGGTLDNQIDDVYKFILKNIKKTALIVGTRRIERFEYPEEAIRELIANAVIHRDYKIIETFTQITVFEDRIVITNPGCLPPGVTIDNIRDAQFSRNLIIAGRLKDLDYLEEFGRGINLVIKKMEEWELSPPLFRNLVNSFQVILLGKKYKNLNERQLKIINTILIVGKLTVKDCLKILEGTPRATINKDLKDLREFNIIKSQGASVNTFYTIGF